MNIDVVLVRTKYPRNIGATARSMANLDAGRLLLVDPKCQIEESARQAAAGAQGPLSSALTFANWEDFYRTEGHGVRIALTRRHGKNRHVFSLPETLKELRPDSLNLGRIYLVFGPEASGLDADDMAFVNHACHLPVDGEFNSLNLAQAVLLALFVTKQALPPTKSKVESAIPQPLRFPDDLIKEWITSIGFEIDARKASAYLTLRRLLLQNQPTEHENHVLEAVLQQTVRKLKRR
jgi:TrmH family RNA methyltransferase